MTTCSGDESVDAEESRVVEETLGVNADTENGLCQFITIPITDSLDQKTLSFCFAPNLLFVVPILLLDLWESA